jgi:polyisoprenoid-binding protein YceI
MHPAFNRSKRAFFCLVTATLIAGVALAATAWRTEPTRSKLAFVGTQAGAQFEGVFERFTANINFDPKSLADSKFDVTIDVKSVNSKDKERDDIIRSADIFAANKFPAARYVADKFVDNGGGKFTGHGKLTLRDVTRDTPIEFTYTPDASGAILKGSAKIKRLDFGVGQGEWKDTQWVANEVRVDFNLKLNK